MTAGWTTLEIGGRRADLFVPAEPPVGAVLALHGYSGETLKASPRFTQELEQRRLWTVCPDGGRSWWLDVETPEFAGTTPMQHLLTQVVPWIEASTAFRRPNIGLLGIGMGGQGALNLAYRNGRSFAAVAAISPTIDFQKLHGKGTLLDEMFASAELVRQQTPILHLHPLNWPDKQFFCCDPRDPLWFESCERLASKLSSSGIPFESDLTTRAGQTGWGWDYFDAMALRATKFLADALAEGGLRRQA
jgi:pimeloyl-ACP methyl ester carboxylesterase